MPLGRRAANVTLSSPRRQLHLLLSLSEAVFSLTGLILIAMRTGYAPLVVRGGFLLLGDGVPAGVALVEATLRQIVIDRDTRIENETLALPA